MERRFGRLQALWMLALAALCLRLAHLQLIQGGRYLALAEHNRLRLVPESAPRGLIVDRRGRALATNQTVFRVAVIPQETEQLPAVLSRVSAIVHRPADALAREYRQARTYAFMPAIILSRVPKDVAIRLEEERWRLPGLLVQPEIVRHYPMESSAAHLVGYLSQPTAEELPLLKPYGVQPKHLVGRMGIERLLDHALRGRSGGLLVEVNHRGRQVGVIGRREPESGARVVLTIDATLQTLIERALGEQPGAAVVLDPDTGEVLAMASVPAFNPELFISPNARAMGQLLNDRASPLMNRAANGTYQPGSIIKLATATAALEAKIITPSSSLNCPGFLTIGDRTIHCWNRDGHGPMTLTDALMQSCNVYFMQAGRRAGLARLRATLEQAGLSRLTGWPLEEQPGHLPKRRLTEGEVAMLSIGQGEILVTPLQAAVMASAFANNGWLVEPWVVRSVAGRALPHPASRRPVGWSPSTLDAVRVGMRAVVNDPDGTGHRAFSERVTIAGKTGTAQTQIPGHSHGWFVGFCPIEHPRAAMAILVEHGGSGGDLPAEVAKAICEHVAAPEAL